MKNKKGFTLVEFLAIIGVLAILGLVFTPTIIKLFQETEKKAFIKKVEELVNTARNVKVEDTSEVVIEILNGEYASATNLKVKNDLPIYGKIKVNKEGQVAIAAQDTKWCITKTYKEDDIKIKEYNGYCDVLKSTSIAGVAVDIQVTDSGVYMDNDDTLYNANLPYASKYYYKGEKPDNYLVFANKCWRIINIANNNTIKLIYEGSTDTKNTCSNIATSSSGTLGTILWNNKEDGLNKWTDSNTEIRTTLETLKNTGNYEGTNKKITFTNEELELIDNATWYNGSILYNKYTPQRLSDDITSERDIKSSYIGKFGLINPSDFIKASTKEECDSLKSSSNDIKPCSSGNYLLKNYSYWTLNAVSEDEKKVWTINPNGKIEAINSNKESVYLRPVIYLVNTVKLKGQGKIKKPFILDTQKETIEIDNVATDKE